MDPQDLPYDAQERESEEKRRELPQNLLLADECEEIGEAGDHSHNDHTCNDQLCSRRIKMGVKIIFQFYRHINLKDSVFSFEHGFEGLGAFRRFGAVAVERMG